MTLAVDVIGDVHGQFDKLTALLTHLGYRDGSGPWRHPDRIVVFVGDLIDRGPKQLATVELVRAMVDAGTAGVSAVVVGSGGRAHGACLLARAFD